MGDVIDFDLIGQHAQESVRVLKALAPAHRYLAELKGGARSIPNEGLLISTLALQEAQSSSEIENIITTQDALYQLQIQPESSDPVSKEVARYTDGLLHGYQAVQQAGGLSINSIIDIQATLVTNNAGVRKTPGTVLRHDGTGDVIYTPPAPDQIMTLLHSLEGYLNQPNNEVDSLVRMSIAHHNFETIHPFYDGNGRTGRILNILYLVNEGLLDSPILYLSRYISQTKSTYYELLQYVRDTGDWIAWIEYMLRGIAVTAKHTTALVEKIRTLLLSHKTLIRDNYKFYSQDLINHIFRHPYTKVAFLQSELAVSRATATRYLTDLANGGILSRHKLGRELFFVNEGLTDLLFNLPPLEL